jgi:hypothetical protein
LHPLDAKGGAFVLKPGSAFLRILPKASLPGRQKQRIFVHLGKIEERRKKFFTKTNKCTIIQSQPRR